MNRPPRVLLIGRHFWPHGSIDSACYLLETACALQKRGAHIEVVTPRYASSWPERIDVREVPVHRPVVAPRSDWSMGRYVRGLTSWLQQQAGQFDVICVDSMRDEAFAAVEAARQHGIKSVLRCRGWGANCDTHWWGSTRAARRCGTISKSADAVMVSSGTSQRRLLANGFAPSQIERIPIGFSPSPTRTPERRWAARRALASANGDLFAEPKSPVLVCAAPMVKDDGIDLLLRASHLLVTRYPDLRLWFVGDGPYRDSIHQYLRAEGVRASVAMPGSFCDTDDIFAAADVYVQLNEEGLDHFLPSVISSELPIVAFENASVRELIAPIHDASDDPRGVGDAGEKNLRREASRPNELIEWCEVATSKGLRLAVCKTLDNLEDARTRASELRRKVVRTRPQSDATEALYRLLERLARQAPPQQWNSQAEAVS